MTNKIMAAETLVTRRQTIAEVGNILGKYDAVDVTYIGPAAAPVGVVFWLTSEEFGSQQYALRVDVASVERRMKRGRKTPPTSERAAAIAAQAVNVAWRILAHWLRSHLAAVDSGLFAACELFSPFMLISATHTVYDKLRANGPRLLAAPEARRGRVRIA